MNIAISIETINKIKACVFILSFYWLVHLVFSAFGF